jgi:hypothetical protein
MGNGGGRVAGRRTPASPSTPTRARGLLTAQVDSAVKEPSAPHLAARTLQSPPNCRGLGGE